MNMNVEEQQKIGEDQELKGVDAAMYLGNKLNKKASIKEEITHRMQQVTSTWNRLHVYWKTSEASKKWQLLAYDAIIKSKLLYGLETAEVGTAELNRIDAFQIRGIRKILLGKNTLIRIDRQRMMYYSTWQAELSVKQTRKKHKKRESEPRRTRTLEGERNRRRNRQV